MTQIPPPNSDPTDALNHRDLNDRDTPLVAFLRQHAPPVPEAPSNAEERLMAAITAQTVTKPVKTDRTHRSRLMVAAGCSVLVYALWQLFQVMLPTHQPIGELAEIENFWFQNWDGVANAEDTSPFFADNDARSDIAPGQPPRSFDHPPSN